ncbi:MAG: hypothetical protein [Circular genetic element sp.]|nr:MAG: hypothetical protein [Circular genetic element sp.]
MLVGGCHCPAVFSSPSWLPPTVIPRLGCSGLRLSRNAIRRPLAKHPSYLERLLKSSSDTRRRSRSSCLCRLRKEISEKSIMQTNSL